MRFGLKLSLLVSSTALLAAGGCATGWQPVGPCDCHQGVPMEAAQMLVEIARLADSMPYPVVRAHIHELCVRCAADYRPVETLTAQEHCQRVCRAYTAAKNGDWATVRGELEHGH